MTDNNQDATRNRGRSDDEGQGPDVARETVDQRFGPLPAESDVRRAGREPSSGRDAAALTGSGSGPADDTFDPGEHTLDEVAAYLRDHPDQRDRVVKAERRRGEHARKGIVGED